jgi:hypothetical protein
VFGHKKKVRREKNVRKSREREREREREGGERYLREIECTQKVRGLRKKRNE